MKASEYLKTHWNKNQIWTHLEWEKHQKRLSRCTDFLKGRSFCDVGCGKGHSTEIMARYKKGKWSAIEFFKPNVDDAKKLFPKIDFYYCDEETYHMNKATGKQFDSVVCSEVIEHVKKDKRFIANLLRITRKVLIMTTPCKRVSDPGHVRLYTEQSLKAVLDYLKVKDYQILREFPFFYIVVNK